MNPNNTNHLCSQLPPPPIPPQYDHNRSKKCRTGAYKHHYKTCKNTSNNTDLPPYISLKPRSVSIEEPVPQSCPNSPNISTVIHRHNIPMGLPSRPSPTKFGLETVSELKEDNHKVNWIAPPEYITVDVSNVSNVSNVSYTANSAVFTNSPASSYQDSRYQSPSMSSTNRSLSTSVSSPEDHSIQLLYTNTMMQCPTNNDNDTDAQNTSNNTQNTSDNSAHASGNTQNTDNRDNKDSDTNDDSDEKHKEGSDQYGSGGNDNGDDDDGKKRENTKDIDDNKDDEEEEEDEEEAEAEEEDDDDDEKGEKDKVTTSTWSEFNNKTSTSNLNGNAAVFKPRRSLSTSSLLTIDEHAELRNESKSAPMPHKPRCRENNQYKYIPNKSHGYIKISKTLTENIIPKRIGERIVKMYDFMNKSTMISMYNDHDNERNIDDIKILNYGFHDKCSNECLYLVAERKTYYNYRIHEYNQYIMREQMFTKNEICDLYNITEDVLPLPIWSTLQLGDMHTMNKIHNLFKDPAALCQKVIFNTKWHKLPVLNAMRRNKQYNKRRLTFSMTKIEFMDTVERSVHNEKNELFPIVMFNDHKYRMEYVQMVKIRNNICIGVSYIYDHKQNTLKATGIHLNKCKILQQHQLTAPHHDFHCLDGFQSDIDNLHIGNPDDDKNRLNALKKTNDDLKHENNNLKLTNAGLEDEVVGQKEKIEQLHCVIKKLKNRGKSSNSMSHSNTSFPMTPTPISIHNSQSYTARSITTPQSISSMSNTSFSFSGSNSALLNLIIVAPPTPITCAPIVYSGNHQKHVLMLCNSYSINTDTNVPQ